MNEIISFYSKIYKQELSQSKMLHLNSSRITKRIHTADKEELLTGEHPRIPLNDKDGVELTKILALKSNEVELRYFSLARVSKFISLNKYESTRIYPLLSYEAHLLFIDGAYYMEIDLTSRNVLKNNLPQTIAGSDEFRKLKQSQTIDIHFTSKLKSIIDKYTPEAKTDELILFPKLWKDRQLKQLEKETFKVEERYLPIGVLAIVQKESNSFTTLNELESLAESGDLSAPLRVLLEQSENTKEEKCGIICEELNTSQYQAIVNSNEKIISVISGPPGTGKSFTIANIAAEKVSKGQSVLISSKNKEALAVIESKIGSQLGISNLCVNPSEDKNFTGLKAHLSHILGRKFIRKNIDFSAISVAFEEFQSLHDKHLVEEKKLIHQFENERTHHQRLKDTAKKELPASLKQRVYEFRSKDSIPLWEGLDQYYNSIEKIRSQAVASLKLVNDFRIEQGINEHRSTLRTYHSFLKARNQKRKEMLGAEINYSVILRSFPVWLIRANDVSRVLPFEKEVFDVLIIDEASQCDIPSLIPLMQRAKKVIIVGDIKQLNHISFISTAFEMGSKINVSDEEKYLCRHRDYSILHLAEEILDPMDQVELTEHFRSQFPIISFSNREFYKNNLEILTKRPISIAKHVEFVRTKGKRLKGVLRSEIGLILKEITRIIKEEETLPDNLKTSIGVLSPFRKQVDALFTELFQEFSLEIITAHKITVGTAFTFQGNERDLMLISFGLDKDALSGSFTFLNRDDVFNVSITRARNRQVFYYSFDPENLKWESTLGVFFRFYQEELKFDSGRETHDEFCKEIEKIFTTQNIKTWTNFQLSGLSIDLLIKTEHQFIGIDLIGFPGEMEDYYSLERYKMMQRGKINVFPLPFALWRGDPERCKQTLLSLINNFNPPPKHSLH